MRISLTRFLPVRLLLICLIAFALVAPASAQSVSIIRDAEVEQLIKDFANPLLRAADLPRNPRVYLVADRRFNAFVVESGSIYINYGTILEAESPSALKAVIAHEIGHLAGGHVARIKEQAAITGRLQVVAMLLGIGAIAASSGSGGEVGEMASAFILASQSIGRNSLMAYRQSEELAADSAAVKLLERSGQSAKGVVDVLTRLSQDEIAKAGAAPYLSTHPLASERLDAITRVARSASNWGRGDSSAERTALALAQAKLAGFLDSRESVLNRFPNSDKSLAARYARVIAAYKGGGAVSALTQMPNIVAAAPSNPYFQELLGQMYFETGQAQKALPPLRRAVELAPGQTEIRVLYGQALVDAGGEKNLKEALAQLNRVANEDPTSVRAYVSMGRAFEALGRRGEATLAAAEAALASGNKGTALGLARQAQKELTQGTPAWLKADDIILSLS